MNMGIATTMKESRDNERAMIHTLDEAAVGERLAFSARAFGMHNAVWMLMLSGLAARIAAIILQGGFGAGAAADYGSIAAGLLEGNGFAFNESAIYTQHGVYEPSSAQPPIYPLLLAGIYSLLGVKTVAAHAVAMVINAVLGAITIPLAYAAARRMGAQHAIALGAAALLAFWPTQIYAATHVHPLILMAFLLTLSTVLFYRSIELQSLTCWAGFCLVSSLAALSAPVLLPALLAGLLMVLFSRSLPRPLRMAFAALMVASSLAVIGPWMFRNWRVHGTLQPVAANFWAGAWRGNNPFSAGTERPVLTEQQRVRYWNHGVDDLRQFDLLSDAQRQALDGKRTAQREALWRDWTLAWVRENPARYFGLCAGRLARTLWADWDDPRSRDPYFLYFASRSALLAGLLIGLPLAILRGWRLGWPLVLALAVFVTCTLTVTGARHAMPLEPLQLSLVSLLLFTGWQRVKGERVRPPMVRRFTGETNDGTSAASLGLQD